MSFFFRPKERKATFVHCCALCTQFCGLMRNGSNAKCQHWWRQTMSRRRIGAAVWPYTLIRFFLSHYANVILLTRIYFPCSMRDPTMRILRSWFSWSWTMHFPTSRTTQRNRIYFKAIAKRSCFLLNSYEIHDFEIYLTWFHIQFNPMRPFLTRESIKSVICV